MRWTTGLAIIGAILAIVSGVELLTHGPLSQLDWRVAWAFWPIQRNATTNIGTFLYHVGQPWIAVLVVGALTVGYAIRRRQSRPVLAAAVALGLVGICTWSLKHVFPHPSILGHLPGSFPSGHTAVAVVASGMLAHLVLPRRDWHESAVVVIAAIWGGVMAWGRLVTESHWLSDVIAGWGIGMVALVLALRTADWQRGTPGSAQPAPADR